jgi:hypothetical protein
MWNESKTLSWQAMIFGPSKYCANGFLCDFYHSFGTYFAVEYGLERSDIAHTRLWNFVFPQLRNLGVEVAAKITKVLRDNVHPNMASSYSSKSIRKGMATFLHSKVSESELEYRGGWSNGSNSKSYKEDNLSLSLPGMNAMAGWSELQNSKMPPSLDALGDHLSHQVDEFVKALYLKIDAVIFQPGNRLHPFLRACTASLLLYFVDVKRRYGESNRLIQVMINAAEKEKIHEGQATDAVGMLSIWCDKVKSKFLADNVQFASFDGSNPVEQFRALQGNSREMASQIQRLERENASLRDSGERLERKVDGVTDLVLDLRSYIVAGRSNARVHLPQDSTESSGSDDNVESPTCSHSGSKDADITDKPQANNGGEGAHLNGQSAMKKMQINALAAGHNTGTANITQSMLLCALHKNNQLCGKREFWSSKSLTVYPEPSRQRAVLELAEWVMTDEQWAVFSNSAANEGDVRQAAQEIERASLARMVLLEGMFENANVGTTKSNTKKTRPRHMPNFGGFGKRINNFKTENGFSKLRDIKLGQENSLTAPKPTRMQRDDTSMLRNYEATVSIAVRGSAFDANPGEDGILGSREISTHPRTGMAETSVFSSPTDSASWRMAKWLWRGLLGS